MLSSRPVMNPAIKSKDEFDSRTKSVPVLVVLKYLLNSANSCFKGMHLAMYF
jgi:hypothetical protein